TINMPEKMSAVVWDGAAYPGCLSLREWPVPEPPPGWVLVRNRAAGICGSDLHLFFDVTRHLVPEKNLPAILGHENAGVVVKLGEGVTRVRPGDRVAVEPLHGCLQFGKSCPRCLTGQYHLCASGLAHVGIPVVRMLPGGWGEYSIVHETRVEPIPDRLSFEEAALTDILACGVHAANLADARPGESAVVIGCGIIGLDLIQVLKTRGVTDLIAIARHEFQAEYARRLGATETVTAAPGIDPVREVMRLTAGAGADQVYECVGGETDGVDQAIAMARPGGLVAMLGEFAGRRPIDLLTMLNNEVRILPSNSYATAPGGKREFQVALELLRDGRVIHSSLVTHRFAPEQFGEAIEAAVHKGKQGLVKGVFVREG
ncbi:MAG: alcohol dehydrogenase catalytic domain-containing protein, partial [Chloroflexi bacterium]|nr:alcohol dehydrogenase catalytic domain-containing protein [Chloroflexota bacterium]